MKNSILTFETALKQRMGELSQNDTDPLRSNELKKKKIFWRRETGWEK